jgi:hypothetical protein
MASITWRDLARVFQIYSLWDFSAHCSGCPVVNQEIIHKWFERVTYPHSIQGQINHPTVIAWWLIADLKCKPLAHSSHFVLRKREKTFDSDQGQQLRDRGTATIIPKLFSPITICFLRI